MSDVCFNKTDLIWCLLSLKEDKILYANNTVQKLMLRTTARNAAQSSNMCFSQFGNWYQFLSLLAHIETVLRLGKCIIQIISIYRWLFLALISGQCVIGIRPDPRVIASLSISYCLFFLWDVNYWIGCMMLFTLGSSELHWLQQCVLCIVSSSCSVVWSIWDHWYRWNGEIYFTFIPSGKVLFSFVCVCKLS